MVHVGVVPDNGITESPAAYLGAVLRLTWGPSCGLPEIHTVIYHFAVQLTRVRLVAFSLATVSCRVHCNRACLASLEKSQDKNTSHRAHSLLRTLFALPPGRASTVELLKSTAGKKPLACPEKSGQAKGPLRGP